MPRIFNRSRRPPSLEPSDGWYSLHGRAAAAALIAALVLAALLVVVVVLLPLM